eukprot:TRINITY_DN1970_c0_g1_i1.p1 TRINITY_DN1970_c0_g1~~TRINITY_DN1970_c0_g1_i1.p1  ORF type:complete len:764 (+),score=141.53 TRINITY_DN1970_c0_g1_i1:35-2326(+)
MMKEDGTSGIENDELEEKWAELTEAFQMLLKVVESGYQKPFDLQKYMRYYTIVYDLSTNEKAGPDTINPKQQITAILYRRYGEIVTGYLRERQIDPDGQSSDDLVKLVVRRWNNHKIIIKWMRKLFVYIDRYYTEHNNCDTLVENGLKCFFDEIYTSIKVPLRNALFKNIQRERTGETVDRVLLKEAIDLFVDMGQGTLQAYSTDFEKPFLEFTENFYEREASRWVAENSATEYLKKAEQRLNEEIQRAQACLHSNSEKALTTAVETVVLKEHQRTLLEMENSGFIALLRDQRLEDLSRMYKLFSRLPQGLDLIAQLLYEYVTNEGKQVVSRHSNSSDLCFKSYTNDLLELHKKYRSILTNQLNNDPIFQKAVKDAFEAFINQQLQCNVKGTPPGTPAAKIFSSELIANYCDMLMKNSGEKMGEDELEDLIERVVALFGYINDKDLFQEFYRKQLSKRLLMTNVHDDIERSLISKLKMRQGAPYTSRLEGMITDKNLSSELQQKFKQYLTENSVSFGFDFSVQVLTTGFWPAFQSHTLEVPPNVKTAMDTFGKFYDARTQSRKLRWVHSLGTVTLDALFNKQKFQLQMNIFQASILLLFNLQDSYSGEDIVKALALPWDEVKKAIQSLAIGKYKLVLKQSPDGKKPTKGVEETDVFSVNADFSDKSRKLKIPVVVTKVNLKASQQTQQTVEEDRRHAIEACIVRIMKGRKQMDHPVLIGECISQLADHFHPDPRHIKKRIEDLIAREYLERDSEKPSLYRYLA